MKMSSRVRSRRPTSITVDWNILLAFNPPPGYVSSSQTPRSSRATSQSISGCDVEADDRTAADDKVVSILKKILSDLEADIENDRRVLKVTVFFSFKTYFKPGLLSTNK